MSRCVCVFVCLEAMTGWRWFGETMRGGRNQQRKRLLQSTDGKVESRQETRTFAESRCHVATSLYIPPRSTRSVLVMPTFQFLAIGRP